MTLRGSLITSAIIMSGLFPVSGSAFTAKGQVEGVEYSIYGPSWIWQRNEVNILFTFRNQTPQQKKISFELWFTGKAGEAFSYSDDPSQEIVLSPGEEKRAALVGIQARGDSRTGEYSFLIQVKGDQEAVEVGYPVEIIRGPAVGSGLFPIYLPVGVALVWCLLIALIVPRFAKPGAWKRPSEPIRDIKS